MIDYSVLQNGAFALSHEELESSCIKMQIGFFHYLDGKLLGARKWMKIVRDGYLPSLRAEKGQVVLSQRTIRPSMPALTRKQGNESALSK